MTKRVLGVLFFIGCLFAQPILAQDNRADVPSRSGFDSNRIFVGGGLGATFGTVTAIEVSPLIGYRFTDQISAGTGFSYQYYRDSRVDNFSTSIIGWNTFGRYLIMDNLFAQAEYEVLRWKDSFGNKITTSRLPIGGGYRQAMGGNVFLNIIAMYDILYKETGPFGNPFVFRMGVNVGL